VRWIDKLYDYGRFGKLFYNMNGFRFLRKDYAQHYFSMSLINIYRVFRHLMTTSFFFMQ